MRTDRGLVREQNEDAVGGDPSEGLIILADGMGGANAGEVASQLAVDLLVSQLVGDEEAHLLQVWGEDYRAYLGRTGRFIPRLGRLP